MNFLNPSALWLLLSIPVLIIAYIIKTQYEERHISSTFIWKRSELLIKKKMPWQILRRSIIFLLQLLILASISLITARPTMTVSGKGEEYVLIIDGSASMQTKTEGVTRFERAIDEAVELASQMKYGNKATVIYTGDKTSYMISRSDSAIQVVNVLESLTCSDFSADFDNALTLARLIQEQNKYAKIFYYTDKNYTDVSDVNVVNVALENEWNVAAQSLSVAEENGGSTVFMSTIVSYGTDADLTVALYVNGKVVDAKMVSAKANEPQNIYWTGAGVKSFTTAEVFIEAEDGNLSDNSFFLCNTPEKTRNVLLISQEPKFMQSILAAFSEYKVTTHATVAAALESLSDEETTATVLSGYDLYIFDGECPEIIPEDGAVWMFGVKEMPESMGITVKTDIPEIEDEKHKGKLMVVDYLSFAKNSQSQYYDLLTQYIDKYPENEEKTNIALSFLVPYESYDKYDVIYTCRDYPAVLIPKGFDSRMVIFSFDLHDSNLPMLVDLPKLFDNMNKYCYPVMLDKNEFALGDTVTVSRLPDAEMINLTRPDKSTSVLLPLNDPRPFTVTSPGLYKVTQELRIGRRKVEESFRFYVHAPASESDTGLEGGKLFTADDIGAPDIDEGVGAIEVWLYIAMALLVILMIEWWVYYREQY